MSSFPCFVRFVPVWPGPVSSGAPVSAAGPRAVSRPTPRPRSGRDVMPGRAPDDRPVAVSCALAAMASAGPSPRTSAACRAAPAASLRGRLVRAGNSGAVSCLGVPVPVWACPALGERTMEGQMIEPHERHGACAGHQHRRARRRPGSRFRAQRDRRLHIGATAGQRQGAAEM